MKTFFLSFVAFFSLITYSNAAWTSSSTLFEKSLPRRDNNIRAKLRARASPSPPKPAHHSLALSPEAKYIACPAPGFQQQIVPEIFYYGSGRVKTRCQLLSAGGGFSYCDYDGYTGDLVGTSAVPGNEVDYCTGTRAIAAENFKSECRTICAGPTPFVYGLIDVYDKRVTCTFDVETSEGKEAAYGCSFDVETGEAMGSFTPASRCYGVSVEHGTCAAA